MKKIALPIIIGILTLSPLTQKERWRSSLQKFEEAHRIILHQYVEEIDYQKLLEAGLRGMLGGLDPYSSYMDTTSYTEVKIKTSGTYGGLGFRVRKVGDYPTVFDPFEGAPAYRAGIQSGDKIIKIDNQPTKGMTLQEAVSKMRGKEGTPITLTIKREGVEEEIEFHLIREIIKIKNVIYGGIISRDIGYIRLASFGKNAHKEVSKMLDSLKKEGAVKFILDLRANPGGLLQEAAKVGELFLPKGKLIVFTKGRILETNQEFYSTTPSKVEGLPLIVLVNQGSASASEIVAGAIQDWDVGVIAGDTTFGKGSVQRIFDLRRVLFSKGIIGTNIKGGIRLTTSWWYIPSGRCIHRSDTLRYLIKNPTLGKEFISRGELKRSLSSEGAVIPDTLFSPVMSLSLLLLNTKSPPPSFILQANGKALFTTYASKYVREHPQLAKDFKLKEKEIKEFKQFLRKNGIKFSEEEFDSCYNVILTTLEEKIASSKWHTAGEYQKKIENDPWITQAVEILEKVKTREELFTVLNLKK